MITKNIKNIVAIIAPLALLPVIIASVSGDRNGESTVVHDDECDYSITSCCESSNFTELDIDSLQAYAKEYRDSDWLHTSPDAGVIRSGSNTYDPGQVHTMLAENTGNSRGYDSRFLDISIDELENFLCRVKNSKEYNGSNGQTPGNPEDGLINTIRFY